MAGENGPAFAASARPYRRIRLARPLGRALKGTGFSRFLTPGQVWYPRRTRATAARFLALMKEVLA